MVTGDVTHVLAIAVALLAIVAVGLVVAIARYGQAAGRYRKYEQELARDAWLRAAENAAARRRQVPRPRDSKAAVP